MKRLIGVLLFAAAPAIAGPLPARTVQDLYGTCQRNEPTCIAYIAGVFDALVVVSVSKQHDPLFAVCADSTVTYGAAQQAFFNWAPRHPEHWNKSQLVGVTLSLQETWPCR